MKARTIIGIGAAAIWLTSTGFSDQYDDLVRKGYRWVTSDGPFACRSKEDLPRILKDQSEENTLQMVSQGGVYFLIQGAIVRVALEDKASGMAQIHWDGIVGTLWMPSNFLSKRPIRSVLGTVATPSQPIWVTRSDVNSMDVKATPDHSETATHSETAQAAVSPTP
jgi:hypothetical protein